MIKGITHGHVLMNGQENHFIQRFFFMFAIKLKHTYLLIHYFRVSLNYGQLALVIVINLFSSALHWKLGSCNN